MGNLIKLGEKVISKDRIISAEIVKYSYPKENNNSSQTNKLSNFFDAIDQLVNHNTPYIDTEFSMLVIEYEEGTDSGTMCFYNDMELKQEFPRILATYNKNVNLIEDIQECALIANDSRPSKYAYACYYFIENTTPITYTDKSLDTLLDSLL